VSPRRTWQRLPLRSQLTLVFTALLVLGLGLTGVTALTLLQRSLVGQLDSQLASAAPGLVRHALRGVPQDGDGDVDEVLPSDYVVVFAQIDGRTTSTFTTSSDATASPRLPTLTAEEVGALNGAAFTVGSVERDARWRVLASQLVDGSGEVVGSVQVALPMDAADATLFDMRRVLVVIAVSVVVLGALGGSWSVRRALRPLREIEDTAAAIAAGDLSRRVPDRPASTEVGRLAGALNGMLTQVESAFADRTASEQRMRRFVADASHELRTPLATIRGYGELYRMGALTTTQDVAGSLARIESSATRMGSLVDDLLALARLDEGRPRRDEPVDLVVLAGDAVADLHALDPERAVRLDGLDGGTTAGALTLGDEARLRQVVANLIGNVVQHTPAGSPVEVAVGRTADGQHAVLEVRDHGPGIDPEHAARVFERFYRVDAARGRDSGGAGLGMAIVAAIVDAHGGQVTLAQTPGGGTTVRVVLAAAEDGPTV